MIHVIAVITAKPGLRDSILQHLRANVPAVRAGKTKEFIASRVIHILQTA